MKLPAILLADGSWGSLEGAIIFDFDAIPGAADMESEDVIDHVRNNVATVSIEVAINA
jgi:hypothetical protein